MRNTGAAVFDEAIRRGHCPPDYAHAPEARRFVLDVLLPRARGTAGPPRILECGCGNGGWLELLARSLPEVRDVGLYGFDVSVEMVALARARLDGIVPGERLRVGDALDRAAYDFDRPGRGFDLIFAYDVIQQLPRARQAEACELMADRLAPRGTLVVFDQERFSPYGAVMALKKAITRVTWIPLVPRYYCAARYPPLWSLARRMRARGGVTEISRHPQGSKRALIVSRTESPT